jgi:hypothetical protein
VSAHLVSACDEVQVQHLRGHRGHPFVAKVRTYDEGMAILQGHMQKRHGGADAVIEDVSIRDGGRSDEPV